MNTALIENIKNFVFTKSKKDMKEVEVADCRDLLGARPHVM